MKALPVLLLLLASCESSRTPTCDDGHRNGEEGDVDCGGACAPCAEGRTCHADLQCQGGVCRDGHCAAPTCRDGVRNGDEPDADCGGACQRCADGVACVASPDCASGACADGKCAAPGCADGVQNGDETDADCGGACPLCADGKACRNDKGCASGVCRDGRCAPGSCGDGIKSKGETAVDCGGPCRSCADGKSCSGAPDCASRVCAAGRCAVPVCGDKEKNGAETDVDCGGPCGPCAEGASCGADADCKTGVCRATRCVPPTCGDGARNGGEADVDCGGTCAACAAGQSCEKASDCGSRICSKGRCAPPECDDKEKNGAETDVDCGGRCAACAEDLRCGADRDCRSGACRNARCAAPGCGDGAKNGDEADADCGGACRPCADGKACGKAADCESRVCAAGRCGTPRCDDKERNGSETAADCGGTCGPCADGSACGKDADCLSGVCRAAICVAPACGDGVQNGTETDADCGGSCAPCADLKACASGADCASRVCTTGRCATPRCDDKERNGSETAADCGGTCGPCADGSACGKDANCLSGVCRAAICVAPSCGDGVRNGTETDADCGGSCAPCADLKACARGADCASRVCTTGRCATPKCDDKEKNGAEAGLDCGGSCGPCAEGLGCGTDGDCKSGVCRSGICVPPACADGVKNGAEVDTDCGGSCAPCAEGKACALPADCASNICLAGRCPGASCTDRVLNGKETDVDCGGACGPCGDGKQCTLYGDCRSGVCRAGRCSPAACGDGVKNGSETDADCGGACAPCGDGKACAQAVGCASAVCVQGLCAAPACDDKARNGAETDVDCGGTCAACADGRSCVRGADCASTICVNGACAVPSCSDGVTNGKEVDVDCGGPCPACAGGKACSAGTDCATGKCDSGSCTYPPPEIVSVTPRAGPVAGGTPIVVKGRGFVNGSGMSISIDGVPAAQVKWVSSGELSAVTPARPKAFGRVPVVVSNPDSQRNATPGAFHYATTKLQLGPVITRNDLATAPSLDATDLNGDGKMDLYIAYPGYPDFGAGLGKGDGTFKPVGMRLNGLPRRLAEFDGNGKPDLAVINLKHLALLSGKGDGKFTGDLSDPAAYSLDVLSTSRPYWTTAAADLDRDGKDDLIVSDEPNIRVFPGQASGRFGTARIFPVGSACGTLTAGDFNGDTRPDVLCTNATRLGQGTMLLSRSDGGFDAVYAALPGPAGTISILAADLTGDGKAELLLSSDRWYFQDTATYEPALGVFLYVPSTGSGVTFSRKELLRGVVGRPQALDANGDGKPDLLGLGTVVVFGTVSYPVRGTQVFQGNGDGTFKAAQRVVLGLDDPRLAGAVAGDVDGDGKLDLVTPGATPNGYSLAVHFGAGGWFGALHVAPTGYTRNWSRTLLRASDLDGDGRADLVFGQEVRVVRATSTGLGASADLGLSAWTIAAGDMNGDRRPDLLVVGSTSPFGAYVRLGNGAGGFTTPGGWTGTIPLPPDRLPACGDVADFDADGKADVGLGAYYKDTLGRLYFSGARFLFGSSGAFSNYSGARFAETHSGRNWSTCAAVDLDGDGRPELVGVNPDFTGSKNMLTVASADGGRRELLLGPGLAAAALAPADFDGDGKMDVAAGLSDPRAPGVGIIFGGQPGTLSPAGIAVYVTDLAAGDLNGDGQADLAILTGAEVQLHLRDNGAFKAGQSIPCPTCAGVAIADTDGDGRPDLIVGARQALNDPSLRYGALVVYTNQSR